MPALSSIVDPRDALIAALMRPQTYPHPVPDPVQHLTTHISDVFLAGDYAYKIKKPVDYGFLDFTTLTLRRQACLDELRLNLRLAPEIYLGVVAICPDGDGYRIGPDACGNGEPVEYAVRMRRFPQDSLLDRLASRGELKLDHVLDIARRMATFHAGAARGAEIDRFGGLDVVGHAVRQNFAQLAPYAARLPNGATLNGLQAQAEYFMRSQAALFAARVAGGFIVDGHGDLHLRNMALLDGRVVIFDCIEFNQAFRAGDVISDIAFLTMDLEHRALPALATRFLNEYLEHTGDYTGVRLLDFYQGYRACVRAKVTAFLIDSADTDAARAALADAAGSYLDLAGRYQQARRGALLITCGVSGSGKSTLAAAVAEAGGAVVVRSDAVRKRLAGIGLRERGPADYGQGIYNPAMSARTYARMLDHARDIVAGGRIAILDATYSQREYRTAAAVLAAELGVPYGILYAQASRDELVHRLATRMAAGTDISDAGIAVMEAQLARFEAPTDKEAPVFRWTGSEDPGAWLGAYLGTTSSRNLQ